jgi:ABC-2 type transport system permease protein
VRDIAGLRHVLGLVLRRERIDLPVWILVVASLPAATASAFQALYPDPAALEQAANAIGGNPAFIAFLGPVLAPTLGGLTAWRVGAFVGVIVGIMNVLTVTRHTRAEEEAGRRELIGATAVGRHAPLMAVLVVVLTADLLMGIAAATALMAVGLEAAGSIAMGLGITVIGWFFAGVAAVSAQLFETARTANAAGVGFIAGSFLLRVVGDAGSASGLEFLSWISPIGLTQRIRPFSGERWAIPVLLVALAATLVLIAQAISSRRDVGAGVFGSRSGSPSAGRLLSGPLGLAVRLQRGVALSWAVGLALFGSLIGAATQGFSELLAENPVLAQFLQAIGGEERITDAYLASMFAVFGIVVSAHAVQAVLWLQSEEATGHLDAVLSTSVARSRWLTGHVTVAVIVAVVDLAVVGIATGLAYGITIGDAATQVPRLTGAALTQLPAVMVMIGVALAFYALLPRLTWPAFTVLGISALATLLGRSIRLSEWIIDLSPFSHLPQVPGPDVPAGPLVGLTVAGAILVAVGYVGFTRRDIG